MKRLSDVLDAAGYSEGEIGAARPVAALAADPAVGVHLLPDREPLATLVRLFLLGLAVERREAERALAPLSLDDVAALGLVEPRGADVAAPLRITPWSGLLLVHDADTPDAAADVVTGVNPAARTLAALTVRRPVDSALDIGTGLGVQALLAARHAERVVATDINPRALQLARLNVALNRMSNVELREGSFFDPVAGARYDLVVTNPPFVISPDTRFTFRDGGIGGDAVTRLVLSSLPDHLVDGGFGCLLGNWILREGEEWAEPLRRGLDGCACDVLLLHYSTHDPVEYAASWNTRLAAADRAAYAETVARWVDYHRRERIAAIGAGAVVVRRRSGANWVAELEMPDAPTAAASDQLLRIFEAHDYLAGVPDPAALLDVRLAPAEAHRVEQTLVFRDGSYLPHPADLRYESGAGVRSAVPPAVLHVLFGLDGSQPLRDAVDDAVVSPEQMHLVADAARALLAAGFLVRR